VGKARKYDDPSAPLWCLSYGDTITNILCFFVMLFMFASMNARGPRTTNQALEQAFSATFSISKQSGESPLVTKGNKGFLLIPNPLDRHPIPRIVKRVKNLLQTTSMKSSLMVIQDDQNVKIRIPSKVLFQSGSAVLKPGSEEVLHALLPVISEVPYDIRVEGHSDDIPTKNPQFPSNWELSAARACAVVRFYAEKLGQDPVRFSAQGCAEFRPQIENISEKNREINRRVEIIILTARHKKTPAFSWE